MNRWLLKTEPDVFGWPHQVAKGKAGEPWTGVRNAAARLNLRNMAEGNQAFFYHTGDEKQIVGIVEVIRAAYPDPTEASGAWVAVDVRAVAALSAPVSLATLKAAPEFSELALIRLPRLSVQPVSEAHWSGILALGGGLVAI